MTWTHTHSGSVWRPLRSMPKATGLSTTAFSLRSFCPPILRQHSLLHFSFSPSLTSTFTSPFDYKAVSCPTANVSQSFMFSFLNCGIEWWIIKTVFSLGTIIKLNLDGRDTTEPKHLCKVSLMFSFIRPPEKMYSPNLHTSTAYFN